MIVTLGASGALTVILTGLIEAADRVPVTDPAIYATATSLRQAVEVLLEAAKRYQLSDDKLAHFWDARAQEPVLASLAIPLAQSHREKR